MNENNLNMSSLQHAQPFLLLSKSVKGAANSKLIMDALDAPGVYVFSELYESPNVVQASSLPEVKPYYALLELFLYGTYRDYIAMASQLPRLTATQLIKLKHLSIVTLSEKTRTLDYRDLLAYLDLVTVRELEDLIIDAIYQGILTGKLDQRKQQVQIGTTMGRDLRPGQLDDMIERMSSWTRQTATTCQVMEDKIQQVSKHVSDNELTKEQYYAEVEQVRKDVHSKGKQSALMDAAESSPSSLSSSSTSINKKDPSATPRQGDYYESQDYPERSGGRAKKRQLMGK